VSYIGITGTYKTFAESGEKKWSHDCKQFVEQEKFHQMGSLFVDVAVVRKLLLYRIYWDKFYCQTNVFIDVTANWIIWINPLPM
jgi:hypothetical protein